MTDYVEWPNDFVEILGKLEKFIDKEEIDVSKPNSGQTLGVRISLSYGFRAKALMSAEQLEKVQQFWRSSLDKSVRFTLPDEAVPREGKFCKPEVKAKEGDRQLVTILIGGGHPIR